ncbi:MAG: hypothetical protein PHT51_00360 [Patescibacteria group bacterium]|nr:hypothetical protein [Patescibacteria group bacterium]MDD4611053.1 hypothetical protein [Patescibacteria group bacterium]
MKKIIIIQFIVLLAGTIFAWYNFVREYLSWANAQTCTLGCALNSTNPFATPCFFGAIFFTIAFALGAVILVKSKK